MIYFFFLMRLGQKLFWDNFARKYVLGHHFGELVASGEAAFAKKLALQVTIAWLRVDHNIRYRNVFFTACLRWRHFEIIIIIIILVLLCYL